MAATAMSDGVYYSVVFFVCLVSSLVIRSSFRIIASSSKPHLPPSPPSLPIIGHLHLLSPFVAMSLRKVSSEFGPFLRLYVGPQPFLLVSSASAATEILKTQEINFAARPAPVSGDSVLFGSRGFISASYGDYWRFMKKVSVTELLSPAQLARSRGIRREEQERFLGRLLEGARKHEAVDVVGEALRLTNNGVCRMAMSTSCAEGENSEIEKIKDLLGRFSMLIAKMSLVNALGPFKWFGLLVFGKEIYETSKMYDDLLERILQKHEERVKSERFETEETDLMDILVRVYQSSEAEFQITRNHIKSFFLDIFIAGTNTSAEAAQWAMAELLNHPDVFKKLRQEIEELVGRTRLVHESDIPNLPYLQAVVKETLRLHPPGPIVVRLCRQSCKVSGFDVPKGSAVAINSYAIMRDPDVYDNPEDFIPERFLVASQDKAGGLNLVQDEASGGRLDFLAFGGGRRGCLGANLGAVFVSLAVATMVQCFDWKTTGRRGEDPVKVDMQEGKGMSTVMASPLRCTPLVHFNPYE